MKPVRFHKTKSVAATCAIAIVVAALVVGISSLVVRTRSASPQRPGFDLTSNPSNFTITSAIYASPGCSGTPALLYPGVTRCAVFSVHNLLSVPITVQSITTALDTSFPAPPANCAPPAHFTLPTFSGSATVLAGATTSLTGVPINLLDNGNQDNCENFTYHFTYSGTAQYTDSTGITLASAPNPSTPGQAVTFTATVTASNQSVDSGSIGGTVNFYSCPTSTCTSKTLLGSGSVGSGGKAMYSSGTLSQGVDFVEAVYQGSGTDFASSTSNVVAQFVIANTTTVLTSSPDPSVSGSPVTFTAAVTKTSGTGTPTGTVQFYLGTPSGSHTLLGSSSLDSSAKATFTTTSLPISINHTYAVYQGTFLFAGSTSPVYNQYVLSAGCINGTINGGYIVRSGFVCISGRVNGGLTVQAGAGVFLDGAQINGGAFSAPQATTVVSCGSTITGDVTVAGTQGYVLLGDGGDNTANGDDPLPACPGNTFNGGNVTVAFNTGGFEIGGNHVAGNMTVSGNVNTAFQPEIEGNTVNGSLSCAADNLPPTNDGFTNHVSGTKSGMCTGANF